MLTTWLRLVKMYQSKTSFIDSRITGFANAKD